MGQSRKTKKYTPKNVSIYILHKELASIKPAFSLIAVRVQVLPSIQNNISRAHGQRNGPEDTNSGEKL